MIAESRSLLYALTMTEKSLPESLSGIHIHFVGIKGTGMAALVEIFFRNGAVITGSDVAERFYTDEILEGLGIKPLPFSSGNITPDVQYVVYSSAYKPGVNPDLTAAERMGIPCLLYTEALGAYSRLSCSCGICGVHGKTSTTGIAGSVLEKLDLPVQVLAGSVINSFGGKCTYTSPSFSSSGRRFFVAETCEYQRHFMSFHPQKIVLTSVESDHQDFYPTYNDIRGAFVDYICLLPEGGELIFCADDPGAAETAGIVRNLRPDIRMVPYGEKAAGDFHIEFGAAGDGRQEFSLGLTGKLELRVPGDHEIRDAAAAVALVCRIISETGRNPADFIPAVRAGLSSFSGGKRRSEVVFRGRTDGGNSVIVLDDYGHHPTAIRTTLSGYRKFYRGRKMIVDFMSHTYSRTEALLDEFASSFSDADVVVLHKIYASARELPGDFSVTGRTLFDSVRKNRGNVHYFEEPCDAEEFILSELNAPLPPEYPDGCLLVTMGAGDNWKLGRLVSSHLDPVE